MYILVGVDFPFIIRASMIMNIDADWKAIQEAVEDIPISEIAVIQIRKDGEVLFCGMLDHPSLDDEDSGIPVTIKHFA